MPEGESTERQCTGSAVKTCAAVCCQFRCAKNGQPPEARNVHTTHVTLLGSWFTRVQWMHGCVCRMYGGWDGKSWPC